MPSASSPPTSLHLLTQPKRRHYRLAAALLALLLTTGLPVRSETVLQTVETELHKVRVVELAVGLRNPWSVAILPSGGFLVTERDGRLLRISSANGERTEFDGVPPVFAENQGGLFDVVLDPAFAQNQLLYLSYAAEKPGGANTRLARARLVGDSLEDLQVIFDALPGHPGGRHFGGRIVFLADGTVTLTTGDRGRKDPAQDLMGHSGKTIRVNPDGSIPADNPLHSRADARPEILSSGHRNPQGAALNPRSGILWTQEHGPRGGDEVNIIKPGTNYGWPLVSYGVNYSGSPVGTGKHVGPGFTNPVYYWDPSIAPSGMAFYNGDAFPRWKSNLLVGALKFRLLVRLTLKGNRIVAEERLFKRFFGRIRDVRVGPDGLIYLLTDERNGRLLRLEPVT